jgi:hypothetical protein
VRRVRRLEKATIAVANGDYTVGIPTSGRDEIGRASCSAQPSPSNGSAPQRRVAELGGTGDIASSRGQGAAVTVRIPMP